MVAKVRNHEEYWYARTAAVRHVCDDIVCDRVIAPGTRYIEMKLPPDSDVGNETWWRVRICVPCASKHHRPLVKQLGLAEAVAQ